MDIDHCEESRNLIEVLDDASIAYLRKLCQNKSLGKNQVHLQKIHKFVCDAKENEKRLTNKCETLQAMAVAKEKQNECALLLNREDQAMLDSLRKQLEQSWQTIDEAYEKEEKSIATITELKEKLLEKSNPYNQISEGDGVKQFMEENERLIGKLQFCEKELHIKTQMEKEWEVTKSELMGEVSKKCKLAESLKSKLDAEIKKRNEYEKEIKKQKTAADVQSTRSKASDLSCASSQCSSTKLHKQLSSKTKALEKAQTNAEQNKVQLENLQQELEAKNTQILTLSNQLKILSEEANVVIKQLELTKKELIAIKHKYQDANVTKDLAELTIKFSSLRSECEFLEEQNQKKTVELQELAKLKEESECANHLMFSKCRDLKEMVVHKDTEKGMLNRQILNLSNEVKNQMALIKQMEKAKESYIHDIQLLEEENQMMSQKIREMEYTKFLNPKESAAQSEVNKEMEEKFTKNITSLQETLVDKEQEITRLTIAVKDLQGQITINEDFLQDEDTDVESDDYIEPTVIGDSTLQDKLPSNDTIDLKIILETMQTEKEELTSKVEILQKMSDLLNNKLGLKEEVLKRGTKHSKEQQEIINHLEQKIYNLEGIVQQSEECRFKSPLFCDIPNDSCATLDSDGSHRGNDTVYLMEQLKALEETVATKTREVKDKTECIREQFDIIEELRKCIAHSGAEQETTAIRQRMKKQEESIKSLRVKATLYEKYIRDYQEEVKQLQSKLHGPKSVVSRESHLDKHASSFLQTKKLDLKLPAKKFKGGGYRVI